MDIVIFIIFITGIAVLMLMDYQLGVHASRQPPSLQEERMQCVWTMVAGACLRVIFLIWGCIDRKARRKEDRLIRVPVALETLPSCQPPRYSLVDEEQPQSTSTPRPASTAQPNLLGRQTAMPPDYS
ncbi:hypothetical protein V2G26_001940 [Clonostachys chloroleuca]